MVTSRPLIVGPPIPLSPYPIFAKGEVVHGFQRGSKQLGIPTANFPQSVSEDIALQTPSGSGIYFGWCSIGTNPTVYPMVMSLGWNPFFKNTKRSAEVHVIHQFDQDFYGEELRILILGYIREEKNYTSIDALIEDIQMDIRVALNSLQQEHYQFLQSHSSLLPFSFSSSSSSSSSSSLVSLPKQADERMKEEEEKEGRDQ